MARNKKVEILSHDGQVLHPITDGDCVIFPDGETLTHKLSEQEEVMYTPEVVNSSPMFKVGEGDTSDYSASVLDGAYQEAILKGQTYVNTIQEPSADVITLPTPFTEYERTQSKTFTEMQDGTFGLNLVGQSYVNCIQEPSEPSYVALGENLEFQNKKVEYTIDGQIKSAMLNGQTLVNVVDRVWFHSEAKHFFYVGLKQYEVNKDYLLVMFNAPNEITQIYLGNSNTTMMWRNYTTDFIRNGSTVSLKVTCPSNYDGSTTVPHFKFGSSEPSLDEVKQMKAMLIPYQEGMENWDIPYFEGMQSVTMTTELENVCSRYNSSGAKNGKTFTVGTWENRGLTLSTTDNISKYNLKPNTKYLIQFKVTNLNLDGLSSISIAFSDGEVSTGNSLFGDNAVVKVESNGIHRGILTTSNVISTSNFVIKGLKNQWENSTSTTRKLTISNIMCIEYQNGMENWDLPYFETTQLMKPLKVQSVSKNLFDTANMFNSYKTTVSEVTTNSFRLTGTDSSATYKNTPFIFNVKPNTDYKITFKSETTDADALCDVYDANNKYLGNRNFNSGNNTRVSVRFYVNMNNTKNGTVKYYDIQMEESSTETPYTPHQSKTTSALEPITLRAIGNVKDTLDLSTGDYVQRIGEIVLDGSDDEIWYPSSLNQDLIDAGRKNLVFYYNHKNNGTLANLKLSPYSEMSNIISDKLAQITHKQQVDANTTYDFPSIAGGHSVPELRIAIPVENSAAQQDSATCKAWLKENPIKVQYELANPITRKISLEYPNLQTYTDITHVQSIAMDGTLVPKIFLPSDISYKAMLKPNTSYNVIVDREVISSNNQLTVNLGGTTANITANRTLITTPSTLSNETLTFSGKDNRLAKAMLIEGSTLINGDLPHFDGIGDVKLGRVVENLCMANESYAGTGAASGSYYDNRAELKITKAGSLVACFSLTKELINGKKYFVYTPSSISQSVSNYLYAISFRENYNGTVTYGAEIKQITSSTNNYLIFNANQTKNPYTHVCVGNHSPIPVNTTMTIRRPIICEYIDGMENWDWESIGYFTGTKNIGNEFMRIGNKNLFDGQLRDGYYSNGEFKANADNKANVNIVKIKPNTTYTISSDSGPKVSFYDINKKLVSYNPSTTNSYTFTVPSDVHYINFHGNGATYFQLEEASSETPYVAHKHNSLHILPDKQIPLTFEQGAIIFSTTTSFAEQINNTMTTRIRSGLLDLEPNETYRISFGDKNYICGIAFYDNSNIGLNAVNGISNDYVFTTTKNAHKFCINIAKSDLDLNITPSVLHQVRLEKVTDVTLRSVGDVKDELDLTRGVYIQRMYEVKLNGFEDWSIHNSYSTDNHLCFYWGYKKIPSYDYNKFGQWGCVINVTPLLIPRGWNSFYGAKADEEGVTFNGDNKQNITIKIRKDRLSSQDVNGFKQWLQSNPITVQYPLETPIEHKINIPMKNELNQTIAKPNGVFTLPLMYSETNHVDINSQIYPKVQSRDYISYPVIANNSQLHTVFHNKLGTGNLTVNLCGTSVTSVDGTSKCAVTTPSTISQYELRLSGARNKVSNVCVFSGDYMNVNVPYVQGMMNAVNPIVKNVGKNLLEELGEFGVKTINLKQSLSRGTYIAYGNPNKTYQERVVIRLSNEKTKQEKTAYLGNIINLTFEVDKIIIYSNGYNYANSINNLLRIDDFMLVKQDTIPSQYEPYKENICEPHSDEIITLRSLPNGVCDELNLQTGEYIQRVGEVVLDGNQTFTHLKTKNGIAFYYRYLDDMSDTSGHNWYPNRCFVCNNKNVVSIGQAYPSDTWYDDRITPIGAYFQSNKNGVGIFTSANNIENYLQSNPITVQYELKTPIIKQIDINNFPHSYKDGHVIIESNDPSTNVTAQMTYRCVTNRSGQIQEHTEQVEKQERQINELETLILENIRQNQNRSQNFLTSLISTLEIEEE